MQEMKQHCTIDGWRASKKQDPPLHSELGTVYGFVDAVGLHGTKMWLASFASVEVFLKLILDEIIITGGVISHCDDRDEKVIERRVRELQSLQIV
jgi:hypothetical protein